MQVMQKDSSGKIWVGPIVTTDGNTPKTGLTSANTLIDYFYGSSSTGDYTDDYSFEEAGRGMYVLGMASNPISINGKCRIMIEGTNSLVRWEDVWIAENDMTALSTLSTSDVVPSNIHYVLNQALGSTVLDVNIQELTGTTLGSHVSSGWIQTDPSTAAYVDLGAVLNSTLASIDELKNSSSTGDAVVASIGWVGGSSSGVTDSGYLQVEVEVVAGSTVTGPVTTASNLNMAAIGGSTIATGTAQLGVNVVSISSHSITSVSGDNFDIFFNNAGSTTPQTVDDVGVGASTVEANIVQIGGSSSYLTTDGLIQTILGFIGSSGTTVSSTAAQLGVNVIKVANSTLSTRAGTNIEGFYYNADSTTPQVVDDVGVGGSTVEANVVQIAGATDGITAAGIFNALVGYVGGTGTTISGTTDLVSTAAQLNIAAIGGSTIATGTAQLGVNVVSISSHSITSQSGDNFDIFFDNADSTTPQTVDDVGVGGSTVEANIVQIAGATDGITAAGIISALVAYVGDTGTTVAGSTDFKNTTADSINANITYVDGSAVEATSGMLDVNIDQVVGTTIVNINDFQNTTDDSVNANITMIDGSASGILGSGVLTVDVSYAGLGSDTVAGTTSLQADVTDLSTFTTANQVDVGRIAGSTISTSDAQIGVNVVQIASGSATAGTISTATVYDNIDHGTLMKYLQAYTIGDFGVTGASTNVVVYDDWSGTTVMAHTFSTKQRTWSS